MYHKVTVVGRLGRDPEMRYMQDGKPVTNFSVAVDDGWGDKKSTIWIRVSAWNKQAETCNQYLRKGSMVLVEGRLIADKATGGPRVWDRNDGAKGASFEISASDVRFLSSRGDGGEQQQGESYPDPGDIPF